MVAKGDDDKPVQVPELILEDNEDIKRFIEAMGMKQIRRRIKDEMDDARSSIQVKNAAEILQNERCRINLRADV